MKYLIGLLTLFISLITLAPSSSAQANVEAFVHKRMQEFMAARQAHKGEVIRSYYDLSQIKDTNEFLKAQYISIKEDLKKGVFSASYVRNSIENSTFGDAYKQALLDFIFKNADIDKGLDLALTRYLAAYEYNIVKFEVEKVVILPDGKVAKVKILESRRANGQKELQVVPRIYKWELKNNTWLLSMDNTPNL